MTPWRRCQGCGELMLKSCPRCGGSLVLVLAGQTDAGAPACSACSSLAEPVTFAVLEAPARCSRCEAPLEVVS